MAVTQKSGKQRLEKWQDPEAKPYIEIRKLSKNYDEVWALREVDLSIYEGEFFSLLGASGCGKTTLLRILAGFEKPTSGRVFIDGIDVTDLPPYKRPVNMMFQNYALFPHMNVFDNVAFGLHFEGIPKTNIQERVFQALELVHMENLYKRRCTQLSGGQRQRVALARSLVKQPKLILLDEPLAALDKKLREKTQFELVNIQESVGITFIMVTHDQEEAMTMSSRVCVVRQGEVEQIGMAHELYEFPGSRYVADFIGTTNLFDGIVVRQGCDYVDIESPDLDSIIHVESSNCFPEGSQISVAIRPEKVLISKEKSKKVGYNMAKGIVTEIAYLGDISIYHVLLPSGKTIQVSQPNLSRLSEREVTWDDVVYLHWKPSNGVVLSV